MTVRRNILLVAAALVIGSPVSGHASCTAHPSGTSALCRGDDIGWHSVNGIDRLTVLGVTSDIVAPEGAAGLFVQNTDVRIFSSTGDFKIVTDGYNGVFAVARNDANVVTRGDFETYGALASGIKVSGLNDVSINHIGDITTFGLDRSPGMVGVAGNKLTVFARGNISTASVNGDALKLVGTNGVSLVAGGDLTTTGRGGEGIYARSLDGTIKLRYSGKISTSGTVAKGIRAWGHGNVDIQVNGTIDTLENGSYGIHSVSDIGASWVTVYGDVTTQGNSTGVYSKGANFASLRQIGDISTSGAQFSYGADITATTGIARVHSVGDISTSGIISHGLRMSGETNVTALKWGSISTSGTGSDGIYAASNGNLLVGNVASITTTGDGADGIDASARTTADIRNRRAIRASGENSRGIAASSSEGNIRITLFRGSEVSGGSGAGGAGVAFSGGNDQNRLANVGILTSQNGLAFDGSENNDLVQNWGLVGGRVSMGGGDDVFGNYEVFVASGDSDFGDGDDKFDNSGLFVLDFAEAPQSVRLRGLETFRNRPSGVVSLANGVIGDRLEIDGDFVGGGIVALDATFDSADVLAISGVVSKETSVDVAYQTGGGGISSAGLALIDVSAGSTDPTDFRLQNGPIQDGLLEYGLLLRNDGVWTLVGSVTQQANTLLGYTSSGSYAWHATGNAWDDYIASFNAGGAAAGLGDSSLFTSRFQNADGARSAQAGSGVWFKMLGGDGAGNSAGAPGGPAGGFADLEFSGYQAGADFDLLPGSGAGAARLIAGVTFGSSHFSDAFVSAPTELAPNSANAGVYAAFTNGSVDAGLLAKFDSMDLVFADEGVTAGDLSMSSFGFKGRTGYTLGGGPLNPWSARLGAGLHYTQSRIDNTDFGYMPVTFGTNAELVGVGGVTLSYVAAADRKGLGEAVRFSLSANIEQDIARRHEMSVLDYDLSDNDLRTVLDLGGHFGWHRGNLTARADLGYRADLASSAGQSGDLKGGFNFGYKF